MYPIIYHLKKKMSHCQKVRSHLMVKGSRAKPRLVCSRFSVTYYTPGVGTSIEKRESKKEGERVLAQFLLHCLFFAHSH